ncbi:MAG: tetratricopeptide repeat protein [Elusimicrobia bacterium]|nr:tetratricopeptide repeat protein [Elusimicrobiota bacterium]
MRDDFWTLVLACEKLRLQGRRAQALRLLEKLIERTGDAHAWLLLLRYRLRREGRSPARGDETDVEDALRRDPKSCWVFGLAPIPEGLPPSARALQRSASDFSARKEFSYVLAYRGYDELLNHHPVEGRALLERASALEPVSWIHAWYGEALRKAGKPEEALAVLERATRMKPRYPGAFAWAAAAQRDLGRPEEALRDLGRALRIRPSARFHAARARILRDLGRYELALVDVAAAVRLDADYGWTGSGGDGSDRALAELTQAAALHPRQAGFDAWRGQILLQMGRFDEAVAALDAALRRDKDHAWALAWRAEARLKSTGLDARVRRDLARSLSLDPGFLRARELQAEVYLRSGRRAAALKQADIAYRLGRASVRVRVFRAKALLALGRRDDAAADAARAANDGHYCEEARTLNRRLVSGETIRISSLLNRQE